MTSIKLLVEVEVEREQGLFASRDEISEAIQSAISEAVDNAELTGIGAQSNSDYAVVATDITELDDKAARALWKENERRVVEELPGDAELRRANRVLRKEHLLDLAHIKNRDEKIAALMEEQEVGKTRWFQQVGGSLRDGPKTYLQDGTYDRVTVQVGERWDESLEISLLPRGIAVRSNASPFSPMVVMPRSSNEISIIQSEKEVG